MITIKSEKNQLTMRFSLKLDTELENQRFIPVVERRESWNIK